MPVPTDITAGTLTITNGSTAVTGVGTSWLASDLRQGDVILWIEGGDGFQTPILADVPTSNTALVLVEPWEGPTLTGVRYRIRYQWDSSRVSAQNRQLIELLDNGNVLALSGLTGPGVPVFNGPHSMVIKPESDFINGVAYDVQVDTLADRAAYDGQAAGYSVLVSDIGDGRSAVYSKASNTVGDWTDPAYITGETGATGPYTELTFGPVTTTPYGTSASVDVVPVDPDTVRLDFSIPAGQNGTGTGDVVGPNSSVDGRIAEFNGTTGKLIRVSASTVASIESSAMIGGKLTLVSGDPTPEADVVGAATVYLTPVLNNFTSLWDGGSWRSFSFGELSLALTASQLANTNYDVWEFSDLGVLRIGTGPAWASDVNRGTGASTSELENFQGRLVNKVAMTVTNGVTTYSVAARAARLRGTIRPTANGFVEDSRKKRFVSNVYNPDLRPMVHIDATDTWNYSIAAWRQARGAADNQVEFLQCVSGRRLRVSVSANAFNSTSTPRNISVGIGLDSATVDSSQRRSGAVTLDRFTPMTADYIGFAGLGYHSVKWLERGAGADTQTFIGDYNSTVAPYFQSGMEAETFS